jgi:P4 family phage/plasmid primase-like protien
MSVAKNDLLTFVNKYKAEKGKPFTNTSIGTPKISINIPTEHYDNFLNLYALAITSGLSLYLTEKPLDPSPLRVDLDFRFSQEILSDESGVKLIRKYNDNHIYKIIDAYFNLINTFLNVSNDSNIAYIMEKPNPTLFRNKIKDGIHIIFPHIIINNNIQHFIRNKILEKAQEIFDIPDLCAIPDDIIDKAIISANCWQMYGSKKPDNDAYRVTRIYNYIDNKTNKVDYIPSAKEEIDFIRLFSMRKLGISETEILTDKANEVNEYIRHVLPMMDKKQKDKMDNNIFSTKLTNIIKNYISDDEFTLAKEIVNECLCHKRADRYDDWINLGWALRNIDYRLLNTWIEFSKISSSYVEGECQKLWDRMRKENLSMGTLRWWAKQDNPQRYNEIINNSIIPIIDIAIGSEGAHYDIAKVVQGIYKGEYKAINKDTWYKFDKDCHRWVKAKEGLKLRKELSEEVCKKFIERAQYYNKKLHETTDEGQKAIYEKRASTAIKISLKLKQSGFKDSIMKECKSLFIDEKFEELLDNKSHLLGFENGVYDLKLHIFREGMPDDYISLSTNKIYVPYHPEAYEITELNNFFAKLFTNETLRNYVLDILACAIDGSIAQERFYIFTGQGSNGKSRLLDLIQKTIGDYYATLPIALLTQKRAAANSAQGEVERTKGRRFAVLQEPSENDKINIGYMKELSGNDRILTRGLYKDPYEFKPQFKMILACNELPEIPSDDGGTWRRIRVVEFSSKFCENPNPEKANEFPMDLQLSEKLERYADFFLTMLIERHKTINPNKINEPKEVINATQQYRSNNDTIGQYINDNIVNDPNGTEKIGINELFNDNKSWCSRNLPKGKKSIERTQLKAYFEKIYGNYDVKKGWTNFRFKTDSDN